MSALETQILCCYSTFLLFSFLFIPIYCRNFCSLFFSGNKRDGTETLRQYAEWSQFAGAHFSSVICHKITKLQFLEITLKHCSEGICTLLLHGASVVTAVACYAASLGPADTCGKNTDVTSSTNPALLATDVFNAKFFFFRNSTL